MNQAQIQHRLSEQKASADALLQLLERESALVLDGEAEELERLTRDKKRRCEELDSLGGELKTWLRHRSLEQWLDRQSPPVRSNWEALSATLGQCRRQNDANGLLISQRQREIENKLRPVDSGTYGSHGESLPQRGSSLTLKA